MSAKADKQDDPMLIIDARGLVPPQPLIMILEALMDLPDGVELRARTDRRPLFLYSQLEVRGFNGISRQESDGSFVTMIRRRYARSSTDVT